MSEQHATSPIRVLAKSGLARVNPDWRYHLANDAGRARCGALLNLREWHVRELAHAPGNMCERCARLLKPKEARLNRLRIPLSAAPEDEQELGEQLGLPLGEG